jgi:hypothetical protein
MCLITLPFPAQQRPSATNNDATVSKLHYHCSSLLHPTATHTPSSATPVQLLADLSHHPLSMCAPIKRLYPHAFCSCPTAFHPPVTRRGLPCPISTADAIESPLLTTPPLLAGPGAPLSLRTTSRPAEPAPSPPECRCASFVPVSYHPTIARPPHRELVLLATSSGCAASHRCSWYKPCHRSAVDEPLRAAPCRALCTCSGRGSTCRASSAHQVWASPVPLEPRQARLARFHS